MADMNVIAISGRLTREAKTVYSAAGLPIVNFSIANNRYAGKEKPEEVSFFDCVIFGKRGEAVAQYLVKGKPVFISGELKIETWEDKENIKRYSTKIIVNDIYFGGTYGRNETRESGDAAEFQEDISF